MDAGSPPTAPGADRGPSAPADAAGEAMQPRPAPTPTLAARAEQRRAATAPPAAPPVAPRRHRVADAVGRGATALGLRRPRNADGTLGPRNWRRLGATVGVIAALVVVRTSVHVVSPGHVGIPVTLGHPGHALGSGVHVTLPFTRTPELSVRTEAYTMSSRGKAGATDAAVEVLGADGAAASVDATVLYRLDAGRASEVYRSVGTRYLDTIIRPSSRNCIRSEFTDYAIVEAATTAWHDLERDVARCMEEKIAPRGFYLEDFQLREVHLGDEVQAAIDAKVAAQQEAERQRFELARAQQAAEITRVDAMATADAQQILACGSETTTVERDGQMVEVVVPKPIERCSQAQLTPAYLQFTYIQALKQLVNSPNNSTIILPFDENLTPLLDISGASGTPGPATLATEPGATVPDTGTTADSGG
jgi:prohibitin 1